MPARAPAPTSTRTPAWLRPVIVAFTAVFLMACFTQAAGDSDTYWHLRAGRFIWENHRLPVPDPFSFTTYLGPQPSPAEAQYRYFNLTHEWLWQLLLYLVYTTTGFAGMVMARGAALTLACGIIGRTVYLRTGVFYRGVAAALVMLAVANDSPILDRPGITTILFLSLTILMLESRRYPWFLPLLFLVWSNAHGAYFMGWIVLVAYCAEAALLHLRGKPASGERNLWIVSAAAILASGLNPNGFRAIQVLLFYRQSALQSTILEWKPPALWPPEEAFTFVLYGAAILLIWARGKVRPSDWLLYPVFAAAAVMASRNVIFVGMIGAIVIASYLPCPFRLPAWTAFLLVPALLAATGVRMADGHAFQFRAEEWRYPEGAAEFLRTHHVTGRMFNTFSSGGFLMWKLWPQQKTFIDGRALNELVGADYRRILDNADASQGKSASQLLSEYGIEVIVAEAFEYYTGRVYGLTLAHADPEHQEWSLVYRDSAAVVFMRHPPPGVAPLDPLEALASAEDQCELHLAKDPAWPGCASGLARLFVGTGDMRRAKKWGAQWMALQSHPDAADVRLFQQLLNAP